MSIEFLCALYNDSTSSQFVHKYPQNPYYPRKDVIGCGRLNPITSSMSLLVHESIITKECGILQVWWSSTYNAVNTF